MNDWKLIFSNQVLASAPTQEAAVRLAADYMARSLLIRFIRGPGVQGERGWNWDRPTGPTEWTWRKTDTEKRPPRLGDALWAFFQKQGIPTCQFYRLGSRGAKVVIEAAGGYYRLVAEAPPSVGVSRAEIDAWLFDEITGPVFQAWRERTGH